MCFFATFSACVCVCVSQAALSSIQPVQHSARRASAGQIYSDMMNEYYDAVASL